MSGFQISRAPILMSVTPPYSDSFQRRFASTHSCRILIILMNFQRDRLLTLTAGTYHRDHDKSDYQLVFFVLHHWIGVGRERKRKRGILLAICCSVNEFNLVQFGRLQLLPPLSCRTRQWLPDMLERSESVRSFRSAVIPEQLKMSRSQAGLRRIPGESILESSLIDQALKSSFSAFK